MIRLPTSADWGIVLFRNVELALVSLYVISTAVLIAGIYIVRETFGIDQWSIIAVCSLLATLFAGKILARIAISPLREHFEHLERLSKETLHELNLPVSTIIANVDMLRKNNTDEKTLKRLQRIETAADMLKERYNELDYLIKKQMEKEECRPVELGSLVEQRVAFMKGLYPHVEWDVVCTPMNVILDPIGLSKVIDNIIENGVKYSPKEPIISITLQKNALEICDRGIGMDEITLMRIYDRYYQNDSTMPGYGIGLNLVKRYCDRNNIALHISSRINEGTCVKLEFKGDY